MTSLPSILLTKLHKSVLGWILGVDNQSLAGMEVSGCLDLWDAFQFIKSKDMDKILAEVRPTFCTFNPCPSGLVKSDRASGTWAEVVETVLPCGKVLLQPC